MVVSPGDLSKQQNQTHNILFVFNTQRKSLLTELTATATTLLELRSFRVIDTTQQPHPPSWHITFVPTCIIKQENMQQVSAKIQSLFFSMGPSFHNSFFVSKTVSPQQ